MKRLWLPLNLLLLSSGLLPAEVEKDLTLGIEAVTGFRSGYVYRGYELANSTLDFQLESEITLAEDTFLSVAGWHASESGDDFSESALGLDLHRDAGDFRFTGSIAYHSFSNTFMESGVDAGLGLTWYPHDDWDFGVDARYDFGAEGFYTEFQAGWSHPLSEDFFISAEAGLGVAGDYYDSSGWHDLNMRLSLTYNVNSFLSVTPFAGFSLGLGDQVEDHAFAGLWLAVSF